MSRVNMQTSANSINLGGGQNPDGDGWTHDIEKLVRVWKKNIDKRQKMHKSEQNANERKDFILTTLSPIFNFILLGFSFAGTQLDCSGGLDSPSCNIGLYKAVTWIIFILNGIATVAGSVLIKLDYATEAANHAQASRAWSQLRLDIEATLATVPSRRGDALIFVKEIQYQFTNIKHDSPSLDGGPGDLYYEVISSSSTDTVELQHVTLNARSDQDRADSFEEEIRARNDYDTDEDNGEHIPTIRHDLRNIDTPSRMSLMKRNAELWGQWRSIQEENV